MKYIKPFATISCLALTCSIFSVTASPVSGQCYNGTLPSLTTVTKVINKPEDNVKGATIDSNWGSGKGDSYSATCNCASIPSNSGYTRFWSTTALPLGSSINGIQYYKLDDDIEISVDIGLYTGGGMWLSYYTVPFQSISNGLVQGCRNPDNSFYAGNLGKIHYHLTRPIVGHHIIPPTLVASLYTTVANKEDTPDEAYPLVNIMISGEIDAPQDCVFTASPSLVQFQPIGATLLSKTSLGEAPNGFPPETVKVAFKCSNLLANNTLTYKFSGNSDDNGILKTSSNYVGVRAMNEKGELIEVNKTETPLLRDASGTGNFTMKFVPVRLDEKYDKLGVYSAGATIDALLQ